jgi:hypothetical protein
VNVQYKLWWILVNPGINPGANDSNYYRTTVLTVLKQLLNGYGAWDGDKKVRLMLVSRNPVRDDISVEE